MQKLRKKTQKRFWELDFLRGLCVLLMILDHFMFSAGNVFPTLQDFFNVSFWGGLIDFADFYWYNNARRIVQFIVVGMFMVLCGISCTLSRSNLIRGIKTCLCALAITIVTYFATKLFGVDLFIRFGVIHMLGTTMLIYFLLQLPSLALKNRLERLAFNHKRLSKAIGLFLRLLPAIVGATVYILFFALNFAQYTKFSGSNSDYTVLVSNISIEGSKALKNFLSTLFDIKNHTYISADYYPILPNGALLLAGGAIGELVYRRRLNSPRRLRLPLDPVSFVGRHALLVYLAHQAIIATFFFAAAFFASL